MRRALWLAAALLVIAGCGNRESTISQRATVDAMHQAGFVHVERMTGPKAPSPSAFETEDAEFFFAGAFRADGKYPMAVIWHATAPSTPSEQSTRRSLVHHAEVCNVEVISYGDAAPFDRVVVQLRKACR